MTTTTYIAVHDQGIIDAAEASGRYSHMSNVCWLFLGPRPCSKRDDIIRCVDYADDRPNLYDFAGFDVLVQHNLIRSEHSIFLQYDHDPVKLDAEAVLNARLESDLGMVAFVPASGHDPNNWMLQVSNFAPTFQAGLQACGEMGDWSRLSQEWWPSTQGHAWRSSYFYTFLNWAHPALDIFASHQFGGHMAERLVAVYCNLTHPAQVQTGLFAHRSADVHGTGALMRGQTALFSELAATFGR